MVTSRSLIEEYLDWKNELNEYEEFCKRWKDGWRPPPPCSECKWSPRSWAENYLTCDMVRIEESDLHESKCTEWRHSSFEQRSIDLRMTCDQCPEQYDMYLNDIKLGRVHLRHGCLTVMIEHANGTDHEIYYAEPTDAEGSFVDDGQRDKYFATIRRAALDWVRKEEERL